MGEAADYCEDDGYNDFLRALFGQNRAPRPPIGRPHDHPVNLTIPSILEDFTQEQPNMSIRETAQAQLERNEAERQRLLTRLAIIDQFGEEDPWKEEAVLFFKRDFGGPRSYVHIAVKCGDKWYVTGSRNANRAFTWPELVEEHLAKSLPGSLYVADQWVRYSDV